MYVEDMRARWGDLIAVSEVLPVTGGEQEARLQHA
jgi:hypothetical protein